MTLKKAHLIAPALLALAPVHKLDAGILFSTTTIFSSVRDSDYGVNDSSGFRTYDNFRIASGGAISQVSWEGFYIDLANAAPAPAPLPDTNEWRISFYDDNAGVPGSLLASTSFTPAAIGMALEGEFVFNFGGPFNVKQYRFSASIPAFAAAPGTTYWLSIFSTSNTLNPFFDWMGATGGLDDHSFQQALGPGMVVANGALVGRDRAFTLSDTQAPEPQTWTLMAGGMLAAVLFRRRRIPAL